MSRAFPLFLLATWLTLPALHAEVPILPFDEVETGMRGEGRTVFQGTRVETFEVEILGKLPNIGPRQNLILGRCSGGPLGETGVLAGMSGSPVYVDGKLVGAVAYSWGFSKDAIAGITPIEEMLAVASRGAEASVARGGLDRADLRRLSLPEEIPEFLTRGLASLAPTPVAGAPIRIPISISGVGHDGLARVEPDLDRAGLLAVQGAGAGQSAEPAPPIVPGSAIGIKLARGDVDFTATGTVTWVDGDRILAFGHPLFGLGELEVPLTGARVEALLPSLSQSARLATPLAEVGALRQDRAAGVLGRLGSPPRMIPIRLQLVSGESQPETFSFDVADDPLLAPLVLYASLNAILANAERTVGNVTVGLDPGSVVKLENRPDVELDNLFAGQTAPTYATATSAFILYLLLNNEWSPPRVAGVNLILTYQREPRTAVLRRITLDRYRVRPGETIKATVVLSPYRGSDITLTREIEIPAETTPGTLEFHVGGALAVNRAESDNQPVFPRDLDQLIWLINNLRRNDRVYIIATREDWGVYLGGTRFPNLPPSVTSVLSRPKSLGNFTVIPQRGILEEEIPTEFMVEGLTRLDVEVVSP